jgi:nucleoside-diphosphate-sugar epimerase
MPHAFVTGASGFLGLNLVEQLAAAGWQVSALHRPGSDVEWLARLPARRIVGDLLDRDSLVRALPEGVDAVFHTAADTSTWSRHNARQLRVNAEGTANLIAAARERGARRLVHTSSWAVYGLEHATVSETTPQTGGSSWINYIRSKWLAEQTVRAALADGLDAVIVQPTHVLGRYDRRGWSRMIQLVDRGELPGIPPGAGSFCHAAEVAKAQIAAAERAPRGETYLLGGVDASFVEVFRIIGQVTGKPVPATAVPAIALRLMARVQLVVAALSGREPALILAHPRAVSLKAQAVLGYRPAALTEMIADSYRWLREAGILAAA